MNKIILSVLIILTIVFPASAGIVVEKDNYMSVYSTYAYWMQKYDSNPTNKEAIYHLDILADAYSTNGRISGLKSGMESRVPFTTNYNDITFVDNVNDWKPVLETEIK